MKRLAAALTASNRDLFFGNIEDAARFYLNGKFVSLQEWRRMSNTAPVLVADPRKSRSACGRAEVGCSFVGRPNKPGAAGSEFFFKGVVKRVWL